MPSSRNERHITGDFISEIKDYNKLVELGSGWGGLSRYLSYRFTNYSITDIEISIIPFLFSKIISNIFSIKNICFKCCNFNKVELEGNVIYIAYLSGPAMKELRKQFEKHRPKNSILISIAFAMPGWTPMETKYASSIFHSPIYIYKL